MMPLRRGRPHHQTSWPPEAIPEPPENKRTKQPWVDSAAVVAIADVCGARININFTRMDTKILSEPAMIDGNRINLIPNVALKTEPVKVVVFTAEMRPDQALALLRALRISLGGLSEPIRRQFNLDDALLDLPAKKGG